jgi:hypothetical protein
MRKVMDEADARTCLAAVARSGLTVGAWGRRHGVDGRSLHAWQMNLSGRPRPTVAKPVARLIELVPSSVPRGRLRYVVRVRDAEVEIGDDFDGGTLRRILEVLRAC